MTCAKKTRACRTPLDLLAWRILGKLSAMPRADSGIEGLPVSAGVLCCRCATFRCICKHNPESAISILFGPDILPKLSQRHTWALTKHLQASPSLFTLWLRCLVCQGHAARLRVLLYCSSAAQGEWEWVEGSEAWFNSGSTP